MDTEITSNSDWYDHLAAGMTESERSAFATGVLIGAKEAAEYIVETITSDIPHDTKLDAVEAFAVTVLSTLLISGVNL